MRFSSDAIQDPNSPELPRGSVRVPDRPVITHIISREREKSDLVDKGTTRSENLRSLRRNVGQVGNLRPIVNRPAEGKGLVYQWFQPTVWLPLCCSVGMRPIGNRPVGAAFYASETLPA